MVSISWVSVSNLAFDTTFSSFWLMINQIQMLLLLLLTRAFLPDSIKNLIAGPNIVLNPFISAPFLKPEKYGDSIDDFNFKLNDDSLSQLEIESISTIHNSFSFFLGIFYIIILHCFIVIIRVWSFKWRLDGRFSKFKAVLKYMLNKGFEIYTFSFYIRTGLEMNQFFLVSSMNEIYNYKDSEPMLRISLAFAILIIIVSILLIIVNIFLALSSYTINNNEHNMLGEFFSGLKLSKKYKIYTAVLVARRTLFVLILIVSSSISSKITWGILAVLEFIYLLYILFLRTFEEVKWNIIEILNEFFLLFLFISLIFLNKVEDWTVTIAHIYAQMILYNSIISWTIIIGKRYCKTI